MYLLRLHFPRHNLTCFFLAKVLMATEQGKLGNAPRFSRVSPGRGLRKRWLRQVSPTCQDVTQIKRKQHKGTNPNPTLLSQSLGIQEKNKGKKTNYIYIIHIHIYIHSYIHIFIYAYVCICSYIHIYIYSYMHMYICSYIHI